MRRKLCAALILTAALLAAAAGCAPKAPPDRIYLVSREDGSGTRSAFSELTGVSAGGEDAMDPRAEITNSTSVVLLSVAGNRNTVGYISLGSLSDKVAALAVDGVYPSPETVLDGTYPIARPFLLVTMGQAQGLAADFLAFTRGEEARELIRRAGYAGAAETEEYTPAGWTGKLTIDGSTSVAPVMDALAERYRALNPGVDIELQQSGSSAGISSVRQGVCDIGMSSRALTQAEAEDGLASALLAMDGVAVIVHPENPVRALSLEQVRAVFTGAVTRWSEVEA